MSLDPPRFNSFSLHIHFDSLFSSNESLPRSSSDVTESFQYATCPQCRGQRAKLAKETDRQQTVFSIFCPYCGYCDDDVSDY